MILTYLVIFLVSVAIMAGLAGSLFAKTATESAEHNLEIQAFTMASVVAHPWIARESGAVNPIILPGLQTLGSSFAQGTSSQFTVLNPQGNALATSLKIVPPNQRNQPEVEAALAGNVRHDVRFDPVTGQMMIYAAAPVEREVQVYGVVQLSLPLAQVTARTKKFWLSLGATALVAAVAAALAGWWLADQLVRPILRLCNAVSRLAAGDLDERVPTQGVAEIAQLATAFNHMAERIQAMLDSQRALVANAAHELRTPLTNIKLRAEALRNGALEDPTTTRRFVTGIESEADRLGRMAADLLALSRQDNMPSHHCEPVSLAALVPGVIDEMMLRAQKGNITFVQNVASGLPLLSADPAGLRTILVNLLDNALQYTVSGGAVTVTAQPAADQRSIVIQVTDTGGGIPTEDLPHIFERFYRADKARSRRMAVAGSGAGLGLAIVRGIVQEHNGTISAQSVPGQGTTITIVLPVRSDSPVEPERKSGASLVRVV